MKLTDTKMAEQMRYPYTMSAKMLRFPFKYHWNNARFLRYICYAVLIASPVYLKIHNLANQPANWAKWNEIRAKREHTHFDPVKP